MLKEVLWKLLFLVLRVIFDVSKDFMEKALDLVLLASQLKHPDGKSYTGSEKYRWVYDQLTTYAEEYDWGSRKTNTINVIIEICVGYIKSFKSPYSIT